MAIDFSGVNLNKDFDDVEPMIAYVPAAADATPQAYNDTQKMHRNRQVAALGEPMAEDDYDAKWAAFDAVVFAQELDDDPIDERAEEFGVTQDFERKSSKVVRGPRHPHNRQYYYDCSRERSSSTKGSKDLHKAQQRFEIGQAIGDVMETLEVNKSTAISLIAPVHGSRSYG